MTDDLQLNEQLITKGRGSIKDDPDNYIDSNATPQYEPGLNHDGSEQDQQVELANFARKFGTLKLFQKEILHQDDGQFSYYRVSDEARNHFQEAGQQRMFVVAVAGRSRIGKTSFLKHCFDIDKSVLVTGAGDKPVTQGMDLILEPYMSTSQPQNEEQFSRVPLFILDCQGLNNQFDLDLGQSVAPLSAAKTEKVLQQQDVLLMAATALYAGVILYYYDTNLSAAELSTLVEASKLLKVWQAGSENYSLTNAQPRHYKPKIIFLRRNTAIEDRTMYNPIPIKEENEMIWEVFDIVNDSNNKINLPAPVGVDQLFRTENLALEDLNEDYLQKLEEVKILIYETFSAGEGPQNLGSRFVEIGSELETLFQKTHQVNIQKLIEEEQHRMQRMRNTEKLKKTCNVLLKVFAALLCLSLIIMILNILILLGTSLLNGENCAIKQADKFWSLVPSSLLTTRTLCYKCTSDDLILDSAQHSCVSKCPTEYGPAKLKDGGLSKAKTCVKCSEHAVAHCLSCNDDQCITAKQGYFIKTESKNGLTLNKVESCQRKVNGCNKCSTDGDTCFGCVPGRTLKDGKCQVICDKKAYYYDQDTDDCEHCPPYMHQDPSNQQNCITDLQRSDRSYININGFELKCPPFMVSGQKNDDGFSTDCQEVTCPTTQRVTREGKCVACPQYQFANGNNKNRTCQIKFCQPTQKVTADAKCEPCPENQLQTSDDPGKCEQAVCKVNQKKVYILENGEQKLTCRYCPLGQVGNPRDDYQSCIHQQCENSHFVFAQYAGKCVACPDYQTVKEDNPGKCSKQVCPSKRYYVSKQGDCHLCDKYQVSREDGRSCRQPQCGVNEYITQEGDCRQCPLGSNPTADHSACKRIECEPPLVLQDGKCELCPDWEGFNVVNRKCRTCAADCKYCSRDYQKCDTSNRVERIVKNAHGLMGRLTYTLEWTGKHIDLDLWFDCPTESKPGYRRVSWMWRTEETCDAKLDVDMKGMDYRNVREAGDVGQLENLYVNKLDTTNYKAHVAWYDGQGSIDYKLYITKRFCGYQLQKRFEGQNDKCAFEVVKVYYKTIAKDERHDFDYDYDPRESYDSLDVDY